MVTMGICNINATKLLRFCFFISLICILKVLLFSCIQGCNSEIYFTLVNKSSEKIKFITRDNLHIEEYTLKPGKSVNFDSYSSGTGFQRLPPRIQKIEIIILSSKKIIKDSCGFKGQSIGCDGDRRFFDRKSYFYRVNKFNECGWYQYVLTDEDLKRAK